MLSLSLAALVLTAPQLDVKQLDADVQALAAKAAPGRLGVSVHDFASGKRYQLRGDERFPMQSVFKAMAAARLLQLVDADKIALDTIVEVTAKALSIGWSPLTDRFEAPVTKVQVRDLVELAVAVSDNTAGDLIMRIGGGPKAVNAMLAAGGVRGIRVDRYEREMQPQIYGLPPFAEDAIIDRDKFEKDTEAVPRREQEKLLATYLADQRDTLTPNGAVQFLEAVRNGKLLGPEMSTFLMTTMANTRTGENRLKAGLPKGAAIAHKTGTAGVMAGVSPAVNDIGIITLADGRRVAIAVLLSGAKGTEDERDQILAGVARAVVKALR